MISHIYLMRHYCILFDDHMYNIDVREMIMLTQYIKSNPGPDQSNSPSGAAV